MVACIGIRKSRKFAGADPVKFPPVHDHSAHSGPVAADEFGSGVDNDIRAVFNGTHKVRSGKGIINNKGDLMAVGNVCDCLYICNIRVGIAQGLYKHGLSVIPYGKFQPF